MDVSVDGLPIQARFLVVVQNGKIRIRIWLQPYRQQKKIDVALAPEIQSKLQGLKAELSQLQRGRPEGAALIRIILNKLHNASSENL